MAVDYKLISDEKSFKAFQETNQDIRWIGLDTEFIGEKRFNTKLCLIQVSTEHGIFIIDFLKFSQIDFLVDLIANPSVVKLVHAGENDFKLFYRLFGVVPKNVFDMQYGAGFCNLGFPTSYKKIVKKFLRIDLPKEYTVADWESRPLNRNLLKYAAVDVEHLGQLYNILHKTLTNNGRIEWCKEENMRFEKESVYKQKLYPEIHNNFFFNRLDFKKKKYYLDLLKWRTFTAERRDIPKEKVLPLKILNLVAQNGGHNLHALNVDRRISSNVFKTYKDEIVTFIKKLPQDDQYEEVINSQNQVMFDEDLEINIQLIFNLVAIMCKEARISLDLVINKKQMKNISLGIVSDNRFNMDGWRKDLLGKQLIDWIYHPGSLKVSKEEGKYIIE